MKLPPTKKKASPMKHVILLQPPTMVELSPSRTSMPTSFPSSEINVENNCLHWYHQNVLQLNPKKFPIRMFVIRMEGAPPPHKIIIEELGNIICSNISAMDEDKDRAHSGDTNEGNCSRH
jgi:hypothetical protein